MNPQQGLIDGAVADDVYSASDIARAAGVDESVAIDAVGGRGVFVSWTEAVHVARALKTGTPLPRRLFSPADTRVDPHRTRRTAVSASAPLAAALLASLFGLTSVSNAARPSAAERPRLIFLAEPGPGGGGGGGGRSIPKPAAQLRRTGAHPNETAIAVRQPAPVARDTQPPVPQPPEPAVTAPVAPAAPDDISQIGILEAPASASTAGTGDGTGAGTGLGDGVGSGSGSGIGAGAMAGLGGGPYRPGAGITPPTLVREVKPDYPDDARRRAVQGSVDLEIVVRRDGSVGDIRVTRGLSQTLDERAVDAVRQWRFEPALRAGRTVDVLVQVTVEFRLR
jgi:TonB family protein